jgi:hypothetical protein
MALAPRGIRACGACDAAGCQGERQVAQHGDGDGDGRVIDPVRRDPEAVREGLLPVQEHDGGDAEENGGQEQRSRGGRDGVQAGYYASPAWEACLCAGAADDAAAEYGE